MIWITHFTFPEGVHSDLFHKVISKLWVPIELIFNEIVREYLENF